MERLTDGSDFPRTYRQFVKKFLDDLACAAYLEKVRWPSGFCCPACGTDGHPWRQTRGRLVCSTCHHETSVTAGTIMNKTRTSLTTWFEAAWHLTTAKNGLSAKTLEQTLGISYRTAWAILQRYRVAMVRSERERLSGTVEVDETFVGGVEQGGKRRRGTTTSIVVVAAEVKEPRGFSRIRMRHVPNASGASLQQFVRDVVAPGATVHTDGWPSYKIMDTYTRERYFRPTAIPRTLPCRGYIVLSAFLNAGSWVPIKELSSRLTSSLIWKSSRLDSTDAL